MVRETNWNARIVRFVYRGAASGCHFDFEEWFRGPASAVAASTDEITNFSQEILLVLCARSNVTPMMLLSHLRCINARKHRLGSPCAQPVKG